MTPKGVADVLSEADFERLIAALIEDGFPRAAKLLRADRRALALHCSEQEESIAQLERDRHAWEMSSTDNFVRFMEETERAEKAEALANAFKDEMDWAIEDAARAEARCVELEAAAKTARSVAASPDYDEEAIRDALWAVVDLALTPTEDDSDARLAGRERPVVTEGGGTRTSRDSAAPPIEAEPLSEGVTEAVNYSGPDESVECAREGCSNRLRRRKFFGPQWCSKEHREGVTEPASSASGGQARVVGTPSESGPDEMVCGHDCGRDATIRLSDGRDLCSTCFGAEVGLNDGLAGCPTCAPTEEEEQGVSAINADCHYGDHHWRGGIRARCGKQYRCECGRFVNLDEIEAHFVVCPVYSAAPTTEREET